MIGFRKVFWSNAVMNLVISFGLVGVLMPSAEPILRLYGRDFSGTRWTLVLMLVSVIPESLALSFYQLIQSAGRMWESLLLVVIPRDLMHVALATLLVPTHGIIAASAAYLTAQFICLIITVALAHRFGPPVVWQISER